MNKSRIYTLKCSECAGVYIGQGGRNIKTRYSEHHRFQKTGFAFANYCLDTQYNFTQTTEMSETKYTGDQFSLESSSVAQNKIIYFLYISQLRC